MVCCGRRRAKKIEKRYKKTEKRYKKNKVVPQKVNAEYLDRLSREVIPCGGCKSLFNIGSDQLKIHCNLCNQFFHCKIAGRCIGEDCKIITDENIIHRASYCYNCVEKVYENNRCLCKDCHEKKI